MMGWSPQCYIPSFVEISPSVPEKKIFEGVLPYIGVVASIMSSDFHFLVPESFLQNLVQIDTVVSEKSSLNFCMYTTLGQGQEMTLTFNTHISSNWMSAPTTFQVTGCNSF